MTAIPVPDGPSSSAVLDLHGVELARYLASTSAFGERGQLFRCAEGCS